LERDTVDEDEEIRREKKKTGLSRHQREEMDTYAKRHSGISENGI
jgi:hypothetical protein